MRTGSFPRLPGPYPATPPGLKTGVMLRSIGTHQAAQPHGSALPGAGVTTSADACQCTDAPMGPSSPVIQLWRAQGWDQSHPRGMIDVPFLKQNPLPQWVRAAEHLAPAPGSQPLSPGTCCAAPSTLPATQALILLQPRHERFGACAALAAWPGPQEPSLVLGCIGKQKASPVRLWQGWPGHKAGPACTRQGLDSACPPGRGNKLPARSQCQGGCGRRWGSSRHRLAGKAEPRDRAGAHSTMRPPAGQMG